MRLRSVRTLLFAFCVCCCAVEGALGQESDAEVFKRGEKIYRATCASCHGDKGQGVQDAYAEPLTGDATVGELTTLITKTMPEGEADLCVGDDAAAVSRYLHYSFYSEAARIRNRPPRIGLARLTGNQLRQSLADLYTRHDEAMWFTTDRGFSAEYSNRNRKKKKKFERVDSVIDFDFGDDGPGKEIDPKNFRVTWTGGLLVETTGRYEIVIRSSCAFVCTFGRSGRELINNHVQSGGKTEFRRSIRLTAGRVYLMQIYFEQRKRKTKQPPANISVSWVPPQGTEQIIPARNIVRTYPPAVFALQARLPPDDRSYGYDRGIAIDTQWDESTTAAAIEFAQAAVDELWPDYNRRNRKKPNENRARLREFLAVLVESAFRGPLSDELRALYVDKQVDATEDDAEAIKRSLLATLKSPRFLYPLLDSDRSKSQRAANRLALTLFDGLPTDKSLRRLVEQNRLESEQQVREMAEQMTWDFRVRGKTRELIHEWLNLSKFDDVSKDTELYAGFDKAMVAELRESLDAFVDAIVWSDKSDYRELFLADWSMTTPKLRAFYGDAWKPAEEEGPWLRRSVSDGSRRFGLVTHPYLMSGLAYHDSTSPIHRGVFLIRYMLGRALRPPNEAFTPFSADLHPSLTTRERVELQTKPENCQGCHVKINGLGFTLENFDAVGRYREEELSKAIDSSGRYTTLKDETVELAGARELAEFLANSEDAQRAFVARAFQHFVKQPVAAYGADRLDKLVAQFRDSAFNIRKLLTEIAVVAAVSTDR